jgi:hypothetical protein
VIALAGNVLETPARWYGAGFWNKRADRYYLVQGVDPRRRFGQPSVHELRLDPATHRPLADRAWWVVSTVDPEVTPRGGEVVARRGPLELRHATAGSPLSFDVRR